MTGGSHDKGSSLCMFTGNGQHMGGVVFVEASLEDFMSLLHAGIFTANSATPPSLSDAVPIENDIKSLHKFALLRSQCCFLADIQSFTRTWQPFTPVPRCKNRLSVHLPYKVQENNWMGSAARTSSDEKMMGGDERKEEDFTSLSSAIETSSAC